MPCRKTHHFWTTQSILPHSSKVRGNFRIFASQSVEPYKVIRRPHFQLFLALLFLSSAFGVTGQSMTEVRPNVKSETLIPRDAVTVFSLNNISLLQKISLDDLVRYEFMEEVQQELFDGSTTGKTLKDSGIDFNQKLNVFYGKGQNYEVSGFTLGVKDKQDLFVVFDDFEKEEDLYPGIEFYSSYFNHLIIKGDAALLVRVEPNMDKIDEVTDSIWYARGNENPYYNEAYDGFDDEGEFEFEEMPEEETDETDDDFEEDAIEGFLEEENMLEKNYYELRDSVQVMLEMQYMSALYEELFVDQINLVNSDSRFAEQLTHSSEGVFYLDNSRNLQKAEGMWYMQTMFPSLFEDMKELYTGNVILGDLVLNQASVEFKMEVRYGEELGSIYQKMNDSKFDKDVLKYIHKDNTAFFSYNVNLREAYEQAYKVIMPILSSEKNARMSSNVLTIELLNEFINKDALFGTYKGSMFGTFNGIQKIKTTKIEFSYDEETFEYTEREVEAEEDMPIFTVGFSTERADIPEKVLKHLSRLTSRFKNMGTYWVYEKAILDAADLYMINTNGLFIFTNDADLAIRHANGYGKEALSKKLSKRAKKSGFMYAHIDWARAIERFPRDFFNDRENEIIDAMRGKTGSMELTSSKTSKEKTNLSLVYNYQGVYDNSGKYLLDLLNSIYVISK
jgi:hypothetical protein